MRETIYKIVPVITKLNSGGFRINICEDKDEWITSTFSTKKTYYIEKQNCDDLYKKIEEFIKTNNINRYEEFEEVESLFKLQVLSC